MVVIQEVLVEAILRTTVGARSRRIFSLASDIDFPSSAQTYPKSAAITVGEKTN